VVDTSGVTDFSLLQSAQTGSGAHPASNLIVTRSSKTRSRETRTNIRDIACTLSRIRIRGSVLPPHSYVPTPVFLNLRALASILPGPGINYTGPRESLLELINNLNVILYLSTCHTVHIIVLILFMIMP